MSELISVTGGVISTKPKVTKNGREYQGVTIRAEIGATGACWFGNYEVALNVGDQITVTCSGISTPNDTKDFHFLNGVKKVEGAAVGDERGWADETPREAAAGVTPRAPRPGPTSNGGFGNHTVAAGAGGDLDSLVDGTDLGRFAGVIKFRDGTTHTEVETILRALAGVLDSSDVREYDPKTGSPVFYIP